MQEAMEAESQSTGLNHAGLKKTLIWYLIGTAVVFGLSALGVTSDDPSPYYNEMDTTPWWSPVRFLISAVFAIIIPLPHILIACLFKSKRNWASVLKITRGWYIALLVFFVVGIIAEKINTNANEAFSSLERGEVQEEADSKLETDDVLVIYSKETNHQFLDIIINAEAIGLLEKNLRAGILKSHSQLLKNKGFASEALPKVTQSRVTSVDKLGVPIGVATVWLKSQTSDGEARSKYIYAAGVIGDTLHKVICSQLNGDDIILTVNPKCHEKLVEVFSARK